MLPPVSGNQWRPSCWAFSVAPVYFTSERSHQFQTKLLLSQGWQLVSDVEHSDLDQGERDFCSARQACTQAQQEEGREERDLRPNSQEVSWVWSLLGELLGKHTDWNCPPWPGTIVTICMSCFMTGDPDKEYGTNKPPPTRRVRERLKEDTACPSTSQNPSC